MKLLSLIEAYSICYQSEGFLSWSAIFGHFISFSYESHSVNKFYIINIKWINQMALLKHDCSTRQPDAIQIKITVTRWMNSSFLGFKREGKTISWRRERNNIILSSYKFDEIISQLWIWNKSTKLSKPHIHVLFQFFWFAFTQKLGFSCIYHKSSESLCNNYSKSAFGLWHTLCFLCTFLLTFLFALFYETVFPVLVKYIIE